MSARTRATKFPEKGFGGFNSSHVLSSGPTSVSLVKWSLFRKLGRVVGSVSASFVLEEGILEIDVDEWEENDRVEVGGDVGRGINSDSSTVAGKWTEGLRIVVIARMRGRTDIIGDGIEDIVEGGDGGETMVGTEVGLVIPVTFALTRRELAPPLETLSEMPSLFCRKRDGEDGAAVRLSSNTVITEVEILSARAGCEATFDREAGAGDRPGVDLTCCKGLKGDNGRTNFEGEGDLTVNFVGEDGRTLASGVSVARTGVFLNLGVPLAETVELVLVCDLVRAEPLTFARMTMGCPGAIDGECGAGSVKPITVGTDGLASI